MVKKTKKQRRAEKRAEKIRQKNRKASQVQVEVVTYNTSPTPPPVPPPEAPAQAPPPDALPDPPPPEETATASPPETKALSEKQLAANRANAQHSTGPVTEAGKAVSRMNATTHGLTSRQVVLATESQAEYDAFEQAMLAELMPEGEHETELARSYIANRWRLRRAAPYEAHLTETVEDPAERARQLALVCRYERDIRRAMAQDLAQLHQLQRNREFDRIEAVRNQRRQQARGGSYPTQDLEEWAYRVIRHTMSVDQMMRFLFHPVQSLNLGFVSYGFERHPATG